MRMLQTTGCALSFALVAVLAARAAGAPFSPVSPAPIIVKASPPALVWNTEAIEVTPDKGATNVTFAFTVTNVSPGEVTVTKVQPSCGCSVARLPANPWTLGPGKHGTMTVDMDVRGKHGTLVKNALVTSTAGFKVLQMKVNLPEMPNVTAAANAFDERVRNIHVAMADRQAVFKGDCAQCHATPAKGQSGPSLYQHACAICHEAVHRASMVPDLASLPRRLTRDDWFKAIAEGKQGTLMPAFSSKADHGPLDDAQIKSLADYLVVRFPGKPAPPAAKPAPAAAPR